MSLYRLIALTFAGILFSLTVAEADLTSQIQNLLDQQAANMQTGVFIMNADTGKTLFNDHGANPMTPASNTKVMTAAAALLYLGPDYEYTTTASTNGRITGNTLNGNLYVTFGGDPTLTTQDLYALMKAVKARGVSTINGNVILDEGVFSGPYYGLGWPQDNLAYCYAAPVAGSIINGNCMALQVLRSSKGKPVIRQYTTNFPVVNNLKLVGRKQLRTCVFQPIITSNNSILLQGCLPNRANWSFAFAIKNPPSYARQVLMVGLSKAGVSVRGKFIAGSTPDKKQILATHSSESLQDLLAYMLKHSDNVYAGAVTKTLGAEYYGVGSYKAGSNAISAILTSRIGGNFKPPYLEDGSGMSVYNLISPFQLTEVYNYLYHQPQLNAIFRQSLAISGQKGTLSYRMTQNGLAGRVFGKTGTINGVSTLSGYLDLPQKPTIIFAIMMNGIEGGAAHARYVQDQIVQIIARNI